MDRKREVKATGPDDGELVAEIYQYDGGVWMSNGLEAVKLTNRQLNTIRAMLRDFPELVEARVMIA